MAFLPAHTAEECGAELFHRDGGVLVERGGLWTGRDVCAKVGGFVVWL